MVVKLSALCAGCSLLPGRFLVLNSVRGPNQPQGHSAAGRIRSIEKSNDLNGNRTRDLPPCSIVPQPTMLSRTPHFCKIQFNIILPPSPRTFKSPLPSRFDKKKNVLHIFHASNACHIPHQFKFLGHV
jgi:hypothetical protein